MEQVFLGALNEATEQIQVYRKIVGSLVSGIVFSLIIILTGRYIFRAWLYSYIGKKSGALVSILIEISTVLAYIISAWKNPGILIGTLVWGAIVLNAIVYGL